MIKTIKTCQRQIFQLLAITLLYCISAVSIHAQEIDDLSIEDLFDVKVMELASGVEQQVNKAPSVVSIVTAEEIKAYGATSVHEALEMVPGLHVIPSSFTHMWPVVTFRGIYSDNNAQVLWMMDGKRISYSSNSGIDINFGIPVNNIKKIEIVRGPASALYGAEAYAGVINLVTFGPEDGGAVTVNAGSFKQRGVSARGSFELTDGWDLAWYGEYFDRGVDDSRVIDTDTQTIFDSIFGTNASLAPGGIEDDTTQKFFSVKLNNEKWQLGTHFFDIDTPINAGVANVLNSDSTRLLRGVSSSISYDSGNDFGSFQMKPFVNIFSINNETEFQIFPEGTVLPIGSDGNIDVVNTVGLVSFPDGYLGNPTAGYDVSEFELPIYHLGLKNHQLRYSVGYRYEKITTTEVKNFGPGVIDGTQPVVDSSFLTDVTGTDFIYLEGGSRRVWHASVQDVIKINDSLEATVGLRYDDYSDEGATFTPRATLIWEVNDRLSTKFLYGSAFRAPSFAERGIRNNPASIGNPNLDNETLDSYEMSLSYIVNKDIWFNVNAYFYEADGLINYVAETGQSINNTAQNVNKLRGRGLETELFWQATEHLKIDFNYALQSTENDLADQQQPFVPRQLLFIRLNWLMSDQWQVNLATKAVFDREREPLDPRPEIDDYWLTNLNVQYHLNNWQLSASIKNLFNDDIREPSSLGTAINGDFPMHERNGFVQLSYSF